MKDSKQMFTIAELFQSSVTNYCVIRMITDVDGETRRDCIMTCVYGKNNKECKNVTGNLISC